MLTRQEISACMGRFGRTGELFLDLADLNRADDIPAAWIDFLQGTQDERIAKLVDYWGPVASRFPAVTAFLRDKVYPPAILREASGDVSLLYPHKTAEGGLHLYQGYAPLDGLGGDLPLWKALPDDLKRFYQDVHNGWTYIADNAMGPLPVGDLAMLDGVMDMSEAEIDRLSPSPRSTLRVFHNGTGSYICLDLAKSRGDGWNAGILWEPEEPENLQRVDFWAYLDGWMGIFFENARTRT
jgi:hypothetical protein